jgi:hypothetical protein
LKRRGETKASKSNEKAQVSLKDLEKLIKREKLRKHLSPANFAELIYLALIQKETSLLSMIMDFI